jgi:molecular chaperone GrpE
MKPTAARGMAQSQAEGTEEAAEAAQELLQMREMVLRQRAEFDNFRKRTQREKDQIREAAAENVLSRLLPVVDNMDRALASAESANDINSVRDGVRMILMQLNRALEAEGLAKVNPLNQPFDPTQHDAIATEERPDVQDNHVSEVLLPGYVYKDKLVRAAMVKVAKSPRGEKIPAAE